MDLLSIDNYEHTILKNDEFQFNCFHRCKGDTPPHWHNHTEIIFVHRQNCTIYINGTSLLCGEGDVVLVPHGCLHSIVRQSEAQYTAIVIGDSLFSSLMSDSHFNNVLSPFLHDKLFIPVHLTNEHKEYGKLSQIVKTIINEEINQNPDFEMRIKVELCLFFLEIMREYPDVFTADPQASGSVIIKMKSVIEYIFTHFSEKVTLSQIAEMSHMSDQHFCRVFKSYTGKTFIKFLSDYRLDQAVLLLKTTDLPISRIPELVGFCNGNYFSRVFKNKYGFPPSRIRSQ